MMALSCVTVKYVQLKLTRKSKCAELFAEFYKRYIKMPVDSITSFRMSFP